MAGIDRKSTTFGESRATELTRQGAFAVFRGKFGDRRGLPCQTREEDR